MKNNTLIKGYKKAYPKVIPHHHLGISIDAVNSKSVVGPRLGRSLPTTVAGDLAGIVQTHEVAQDIIWLPSTSGAGERSVLPFTARQDKTLASCTGAKLQNEPKCIINFLTCH
jgi:hypothetical protein